MRKRWVLLVALVIAGLAVWGCQQRFSDWEASGNQAHAAAYKAFMADLPSEGCVTPEHVSTLAQQRGWAVRVEPEFHWCHKPTGIGAWLRVAVEPALPFSTDDENAAFFAFDAAGCSVEWSYSSCAD